MGKLTGKVALVTGASKGIGAAIARALGREGAHVVVNYMTDKSGADRVVTEIKAGGSDAIAYSANIAKSAEIAGMMDEVRKRFGVLDALMNNAGIYAYTPLESLTEEEIDRLFDTNAKGVLLTIKAAVALFPKSGGSIVNIGALASAMPSAGLSAYGASKGALDIMTVSLSKELGPKNIRVNGVRPGFTVTEGLAAQGLIGTGFEQRAIAGTPLGRAGQPEDIADIVAFLVSDHSRWVTGCLINAAGGLTY